MIVPHIFTFFYLILNSHIYLLSKTSHMFGFFATISCLFNFGPIFYFLMARLSFSRLDAVMCMGVTAGAYILTLFAVRLYLIMQHAYLLKTVTHVLFCFDSSSTCFQMKYRERVIGLILVSPLCKAPSWTEWLYNKVCFLVPY